MDYEKDLEINPNALEKEWIEQPRLYRKYSKLVADAEKEKNEKKEKLPIVKAEMDALIRKEAKEANEKITEKAVEANILLSGEYNDALEEYLVSLHEWQIVKGALTSIDHRKAALENLVKLWIGAYYSEPKAPEGDRIKENSQKKTQTKARKKLNKK